MTRRLDITSCFVCPFRDGEHCKPYDRPIDNLDEKLKGCSYLAWTDVSDQ